MENQLISYQGITPKIDEDVFLAKGAYVIGDVSVGPRANIWFNTVIRGDVHPITIGRYTNIQDNCTVHVMHDHPTVVGEYVTVGHGVTLHACHVQNNCLIGMGAIILSYAEIGENCIIGAGALITEHKKIPPNSLVMGSPGKVVRTVTAEEIEAIRQSAIHYYDESQKYR
ncbi:gamma carbonic anhydrase family protein [Pelosinus sp. sgz500959]|uniref:gamma carbonic anhydrase family protein n=1 Tax=Pelosinus sp. sgz500959 TaxID=3242472 RepID=UPI00366C2E3D